MSGFPAIAMMVLSFGTPILVTMLVLKWRPSPSLPVMVATALIGAAIFPLALLGLVHSADAIVRAGNVTIAWVTFSGGLILSGLIFAIRRPT